MDAISLETNDEKFLITIDKDFVNKEFVVQLIERLRLEYLVKAANFNADVEALGEELKSNWWQTNKARFLEGKE